MVIHTINFRFISRAIGRICLVQALILIVATIIPGLFGESLIPYISTALTYFAVGIFLFILGGKDRRRDAGRREGMLIVTLTWLVLSLIGTIPFLLTNATDSFMDALFETISGFTTTGTSALRTVEHLSHDLLFWRSLMQWQGGVGIVVFTIAIFSSFGGGVSQIYNAETTGITKERFLPRIKDVALSLYLLYFGETVLLTFLLACFSSMSVFDAICHAMTCISTGGYSTKDTSIAYYSSPYIEYILSLFMYIGALNLTLVYMAITGKPWKLIRDEEFRWFNLLIAGGVLLTAIWLFTQGIFVSVEECFRNALFQVLSLGTSTGYLTQDISNWKPFFWMLALLLMFVNGCAGSTSGGLKVIRVVVLLKNLYNEFKKQIHPHLLTPVLINRRPLSVSVVHQILAFCVLYTLLLVGGSFLLMIDGNGFISSLSVSCSCISNSGPGIGEYVNGLNAASDFSKGVLSFLMLAGRLEVFTVITIFTPHFWKS